MAVYKELKTNTWKVYYRYTDWQGERKQTTKRGFATKRVCHRLLKRGMVHFVASDGHDLRERPPVLDECFEYVSKRYGEEYAWRIFRENAVELLSGKWH